MIMASLFDTLALFGLTENIFLKKNYFKVFDCILENVMKNIFATTLSLYLISQEHMLGSKYIGLNV